VLSAGFALLFLYFSSYKEDRANGRLKLNMIAWICLPFLISIIFWTLNRKAFFAAFTSSVDGEYLSPLLTSPSKAEKALKTGAQAWVTAMGGPPVEATDPFNPPSDALPSSNTHVRACMCIPVGDDTLTGRAGENGKDLFVTRVVRGFLSIPLFSSMITDAFFSRDLRFIKRDAGGRKLSLLLLFFGIALLGFLGDAGFLGNRFDIEYFGVYVGGLGVFLLVWWFFQTRIFLRFSFTPSVFTEVNLPVSRAGPIFEEVCKSFSRGGMVGSSTNSGASKYPSSPSPPLNLAGSASDGSMIELQVDTQLTRIKNYRGAKGIVTKFLCALCSGEEEWVVRTRDIQFAAAETMSVWGLIFRSLLLGCLVFFLGYYFTSSMPQIWGAVAVVLAISLIAYGFCTRKTTVVLGTTFARTPYATFCGSLGFHIYPFTLSLTPFSNTLGAGSSDVDPQGVVEKITSLLLSAKGL